MKPDDYEAEELLGPLLREDEAALGLPNAPDKGTEPHLHDGHGDGHTSVRSVDYRGRTLRVETTYRVFIGDDELAESFHVLDNGKVTYHGLPAYSSPSAIDLLKMVVDRLEVTETRPVEDQLNPDSSEGDDHGHS